MAAASAAAVPDWLILQKKIFTRWVNQKLAIRKKVAPIKDVVDGLTASAIIEVLEVLSEKPFNNKPPIVESTLRVKNLDNVNRALQFAYKDNNVKSELPCSSENVVDKNEKNILGFIWALMSKFLKFGDEEEKLSAKDALIMWCANKTKDYKGVKIVDMGKSWHDGLAFCALIHAFRPKLIPYDTLTPANKAANLKLAFGAAEKFFGLEQYLTTDDVAKLDDKSMTVYVSEYFYGIAAARKLDLAARRIGKLIRFTQTNDGLRKEYTEKADELRALLNKWVKVLDDRTIDNTMAGAQRRLDEFYDYKAKDKTTVVTNFLIVEQVFNHLAMRLNDGKRPPFKPAEGKTLPDLQKEVHHLENTEAARTAALNAELNRQRRLATISAQHKAKFGKLAAWTAEKKAYLESPLSIDSVGAAQFALNVLEGVVSEIAATASKAVADQAAQAAYLVKEHYENSKEVQAHEAETAGAFKELDRLSADKKVALDAALKREIEKERLRIQFAGLASQTQIWVKETADRLADTFFGFSLEEVQAFAAKLAEEDKAISAEASKRQAAYTKSFNDGKDAGIVANQYTKLDLQSLDSETAAVHKAIADRKNTYDAELKLQTHNDNLCKAFAAVAEPFAKSLAATKATVTDSKDTMEGQLKFVEGKISSVPADAAALGPIDAAQAAVDAANIRYNRHTILSAKDLKVTWEQYQSFLQLKKKALSDAIEQKSLRGVTPQQYAEIKTQFAQFDKNKNGVLSQSELKTCLFSLGDERPNSELAKIVAQYGDSKTGIKYEGFREFMITQLGDNDTKDEIVAGFKLINKGEEKASHANMDLLFTAADLTYLETNMPPLDAGHFDYKKWCDAVYSR